MNFQNNLSALTDDVAYCVIDVETTGLNARYNNIIEIGIVKIQGGKIIDSYNSFVNPGREIPNFITSLTGISNKDVYNAPFFEDIHLEISNFIDGCLVGGHNFSFDLSFLRKEFQICGVESFKPLQFCTLNIGRKLFPFLKSKSLSSLARHFRIKQDDSHRALSDAMTTARIFIKMLKILKDEYSIYSASDLIQFQSRVVISPSTKIMNALAVDISNLTHSPGVYYFLNSKKEIIYVGKAKSIRDRIKTYVSSSAPKKAKKIIQQARTVKTHETNSELTAFLYEAEFIKKVLPKHNVQLKDYGNKFFLKISTSHDFPKTEIVKYFDFDGDDYFGLFVSRRNAEKIIELLDKVFLLRECKEKEFSKGKRCFLAEIERCTAPCVNKDKSIYQDELNKIYDFMNGKNQFALDRLLKKMKNLSEQKKYEQAAEVRDLINLVLSQVHKTSLLAEPVNKANVLIKVDEKNNSDFILLLEGKVFVKGNELSKSNSFETALNDYFEQTRQINFLPTDEDLEKMKIILNWIVKNRNKTNVYYLQNYEAKEELFRAIKKHN